MIHNRFNSTQTYSLSKIERKLFVVETQKNTFTRPKHQNRESDLNEIDFKLIVYFNYSQNVHIIID